MILFNNRELTEEFAYESAKIARLAKLSEYGLDEGFYGGNAKCIAVLAQEPLLLIVSENHKTLDVGFLESEIKKIPRKYISLLPAKYKGGKTAVTSDKTE